MKSKAQKESRSTFSASLHYSESEYYKQWENEKEKERFDQSCGYKKRGFMRGFLLLPLLSNCTFVDH